MGFINFFYIITMGIALSNSTINCMQKLDGDIYSDYDGFSSDSEHENIPLILDNQDNLKEITLKIPPKIVISNQENNEKKYKKPFNLQIPNFKSPLENVMTNSTKIKTRSISIVNLPEIGQTTPPKALLKKKSSSESFSDVSIIETEQYQPRWLLSLDGGGIRGLMQLHILAEIERLTNKSFIELFDAVAGTSIGGMIACLLTMPDPQNHKKPKYSAQKLLDIFVQRKNEIFQPKWQSMGGLFSTRYKTTPLKKLLQELLGENKFKERLLPTVVVTHNLVTNEELLFSSEDTENFLTWSVATATGAAPTYFKSQRVYPYECHSSHRGYVLSDGGTCMNNPTMAGIALIHSVYGARVDDLNVLSLGTGTSGTGQLNKGLLNGGILRWGLSIANTCIAGQASSTNKLASLYCKERYHRLNPILDVHNMKLDNKTESNLDALFAAAYRCLSDNKKEINSIVEALNIAAETREETNENILQMNQSINKAKETLTFTPLSERYQSSREFNDQRYNKKSKNNHIHNSFQKHTNYRDSNDLKKNTLNTNNSYGPIPLRKLKRKFQDLDN